MKRTQRRGIALIAVLIVSVAILALVSAGLATGSQNVLFVSKVHQRNVAIAAAEAGVYQAIEIVEGQMDYDGTFTDALSESGADIEVTVTNNMSVDGTIVIVSNGSYGSTERALRVVLRPSGATFGAIGSEGGIYVERNTYVNAIRSMRDTLPDYGNIHTNSSNGVRDLDSGGRLSVTGEASSTGSINTGLVDANTVNDNTPTRPLYGLDRAQMLSGTFSSGSLPGDGQVTSNLRISGDLVTATPVHVPAGVTLHITGDAALAGGVTGEGNVVVDGDATIRANGGFDPNNNDGLAVYVEGAAIVTHPEAEIDDSDGDIIFTEDIVGDYFAQMPPDAAYDLTRQLPVGAPASEDFFQWYRTESGSPSAGFTLWRDGDGSDLNPGLSPSTKAWLDNSIPIETDLTNWAHGS